MKNLNWTKGLLLVLLVSLNVACDQVSKNIARENLEYHERTEYLDGFLIVVKVENTGAFLSLGSGFAPLVKKIILWGLPAVALVFMFFFVMKSTKLNKASFIGLSFVIGGGIGNVYDRIQYGSVTDFLLLDFGFAKTGIFNAADVSIMMGTGILLLFEVLKKKKPEIAKELD